VALSVLDKVVRELRSLRILGSTGLRVARIKPDGSSTVCDAFERVVDANSSRPAVMFEGRTTTYSELEQAANRIANWARAQGIQQGQCVALFMENRPEYLASWLGLSKVGAHVALINTNLSGAPLVHAFTVASPSLVVLGAELTEAYETARTSMAGVPVWTLGGRGAREGTLDDALASASSQRPPRQWRGGVKTGDKLFYIYTSGTTGNPKAANFSHLRFLSVGAAYTEIAGIRKEDRIYCVLPLYHTAGGVIAASMALLNGATLVLRRKFSASEFWDDCRAQGVTVFQYIGELCRYLLNRPETADDRRHEVRCAVGNGLRPDIWERFQKRFGIRDIREFYGATEGSFALVNLDNTVGAVGRVPPWLKSKIPVELVRFDVESESHPRGADGWCIKCRNGEPGEAIGRISTDPSQPLAQFEGYTDSSATGKKILRDVFEPGDLWYRSGDLLSRDDEGYYYFVDRIGDTFRWKGENVATSEVAEVLSVCPGVVEANVYGVKVPGADGRAGMAAVVVDPSLSLDELYEHVTRELATYARPLFLRLQPELETTGTFKHRKVDLVRDGFDPERVASPLYFRDDARGRFVPLDRQLYADITAGRARV
jgi:fatty-acyl-CoA synthase